MFDRFRSPAPAPMPVVPCVTCGRDVAIMRDGLPLHRDGAIPDHNAAVAAHPVRCACDWCDF